jgi:hypothetical protein
VPLQLGVHKQKKKQNPIGCVPGSGINKREGATDHHQLIAQKLSMRQHLTKICKDLGVRNLILKIKKLLDDGRDLTPHSMDPRTMKTIKEYLLVKSNVIVQRPSLTPNAQEMRKERC